VDKVAKDKKKLKDAPINVYSPSILRGLPLANPPHGDYSLTEHLATCGAATVGVLMGLSGLGCGERGVASSATTQLGLTRCSKIFTPPPCLSERASDRDSVVLFR